MNEAPRLDEAQAILSPSSRSRLGALLFLAGVAAFVLLASVSLGAVSIAPRRIVAILWTWVGHGEDHSLEASVLLSIRLPRTLLGFLVGAALAVSGALLQGLFRNPLADPGLTGVSAGAALAACCVIVLGNTMLGLDPVLLPWLLPVGAFCGGLATTTILYLVATRGAQTSVAIMLLAGIALAALTGAFTGLLVTTSNDRQLRDLTFWSLGSLGGVTWTKLAIASVFVVPVLLAVPLLARAMNALSLGEAEAYYLGIAVQRTKRIVILLVSLTVGASVAMTGPIGFVGLVVPHLLRLSVSADNRFVIPASALLGGALLVASDIAARTLAAPAEIPIGIVTAAIGAPFFLWLLLSRSREIAV